jgi:FtsZ-binding cell division protein ZapB
MPRCDGRFGGVGITLDCPDYKNDASVQFRHCELFLCEACFESRFPPDDAMSAAAPDASCDNADTNVNPVDNLLEEFAEQAVTTPGSKWVQSELLCFVTDKAGVMAADHLVEIVHKFYREDEILAARKSLVDAGLRLPKRQGGNKVMASVEDIVKAVLQPKVKLPLFVAFNLSRLPPVDLKHCDTSAILLELQGLRAEVRDIARLQMEVGVLRTDTQRLQKEVSACRAEIRERNRDYDELSKLRSELPAMHAEVHDLLLFQAEMTSWRGEVQRLIDVSRDMPRLLSGLNDLSEQMDLLSRHQAATSESQSYNRSANAVSTTGNLNPAPAASSQVNAMAATAAQRAAAPSTSPVVAATAAPTAASVVSAAVRTGALQQVTKRSPKFAVGTSQHGKLQ